MASEIPKTSSGDTPGRHHAQPTLDDVAKAAGVSTATVSRCLNKTGQVTEKTRDRVMAAVESLGYTPNFGARALAAKRTRTIGAIIPTMENAIFARGLQAFQEELNALGYTLLVSSTGYDPAQEAEQIRTLVARGADGLLLIGYERDAAIYDYLDQRNVPYLLSWAHRATATRPAIGFDNVACMYELAQKVLSLGHRRLGIISGKITGNDRAADRVHGIHTAMREVGLTPEDAHLVETHYSLANGAAAFEDLMARPNRPTAVMCINDVLAVGALFRARDMGIDVPGDVSVTGFDDIDLAQAVSPGLTTVHVPHREMGALAARELIAMVTQTHPHVPQRLASRIVMRHTLTAPA